MLADGLTGKTKADRQKATFPTSVDRNSQDRPTIMATLYHQTVLEVFFLYQQSGYNIEKSTVPLMAYKNSIESLAKILEGSIRLFQPLKNRHQVGTIDADGSSLEHLIG